MRTRIVIGAGAWLFGAAAATAGGLYVVSELGEGISASPASQQSTVAGRGGDALAALRYHQQAARGRCGRPEQPGTGADDNAGTHAATVADVTLSASKDGLKETGIPRSANTGSCPRNGRPG